MNRHPPNGGSGIVERDLPQWCETGVGAVMIHKAGASSSHTHVRVEQTPDRSSDSSLASRRQGSLCCPGCVQVLGTQLLHQGLQIMSRIKCIVHRLISFTSIKDLLFQRCQNTTKKFQ